MRATDYHATALAMSRIRLSSALEALAGIAVLVILGALIGASIFGNP